MENIEKEVEYDVREPEEISLSHFVAINDVSVGPTTITLPEGNDWEIITIERGGTRIPKDMHFGFTSMIGY